MPGIANGPSFKPATALTTPTGIVDAAPTVAYLLGLSMPQADGRVIDEALVAPSSAAAPSVTASPLRPPRPRPACASSCRRTRPARLPTSLAQGTYNVQLAIKDLTVNGKTYRYFDYAKAVRQ